MKRDFVFVWSPEVQPAIAALSAPKIAQLRACCERLIAYAEQHRQSPAPTGSDKMEQHGEDGLPWAPFEKFGYWFKLDYEDARRAYVLNFATPPGNGEPSAAVTPKASARPSRARKPAKLDERVTWDGLAFAAGERYRGLHRRFAQSVQLFFRCIAAEAARRRNSIGGLCDMPLHWASTTRRVFASSSSIPAYGPLGPEAVLEPRLLGQNTGIAMLIYTLVWSDEPIDWSADLFGAPESERS